MWSRGGRRKEKGGGAEGERVRSSACWPGRQRGVMWTRRPVARAAALSRVDRPRSSAPGPPGVVVPFRDPDLRLPRLRPRLTRTPRVPGPRRDSTHTLKPCSRTRSSDRRCVRGRQRPVEAVAAVGARRTRPRPAPVSPAPRTRQMLFPDPNIINEEMIEAAVREERALQVRDPPRHANAAVAGAKPRATLARSARSRAGARSRPRRRSARGGWSV